MGKYKKVCICVLIIIILIPSLSVSYGEETIQDNLEKLELDRICYDDEDYLYFKIDTYIARLKKDFTGGYEILSEEERKNIVDKMENNKESFMLEEEKIDNENIEIREDYLYYDGLKLIDVKKYIEGDNDFYSRHPEAKKYPIEYYLHKYILNDKKTLYYISIYTCVVLPAPYTPEYQSYVLVEDENIKILDLNDEYFSLSNVYINNNIMWMDGVHRYSKYNWHSSHERNYYINAEGKGVAVDEILNNINTNMKDNNENLRILLLGMNNKSVVFQKLVEVINNGYVQYKINDLYEITPNLKIKIRNEDISIVNEKYSIKNNMLYLGKDNEIYYISNNIHGVVNLTKEKFKRFNLNEYETNTSIRVVINDEHVEFNDNYGYPFIDKNDIIQVPLRIILENIGAKVRWNNETRTAIAEKEGMKVEVPIGEKYVLKNGKKLEIEGNSLIKNYRTYSPIITIMEYFGYEVTWNDKTMVFKLKI